MPLHSPSSQPLPLHSPSSSAAPSGPSNILVFPTSVKPGGKLTVTVDGSSCRTGGIVESNAFPRTPLKGIPNQGSSVAMPMIFSAARPGTYSVTATCGGRTVTGGRFTVTGGKAVVVPSKGARTGLGGSVTGMNSTETALGGALLALAAAGGAAFLARRRSGSKA
ncbi:hypothetical protein CK485_21075 [Streptomyces sp. ICBB 8177]|nr:hypothetical protein CK485_21075 [Streptomyces sp. ICBB 8177]